MQWPTPDCSKAGATTQTSPVRPGDAARDLFQNFQAGRIDPIVIRHQNSHLRPMVALVSCLVQAGQGDKG